MKKLLSLALAVLMLVACTGFSVVATDNEADPFEGWSENEKFLYAVEDLSNAKSHTHTTACEHDAIDEKPVTKGGGDEGPCSRCPNGILRNISETYTAWVYTGTTRQCPRIFSSLDLQQSRQATLTYKCNKCGYGFYVNIPQSQWACGH